jgi:hypothetical protein
MRDYYVVDEWSMIWNEEPFSTFHQAYEFRSIIQPWFSMKFVIVSVDRGWNIKQIKVNQF